MRQVIRALRGLFLLGLVITLTGCIIGMGVGFVVGDVRLCLARGVTAGASLGIACLLWGAKPAIDETRHTARATYRRARE